MIKKVLTYKATLATIESYGKITLYLSKGYEHNILYDYGMKIRLVKYKNANEAVNDFYNRIKFIQKYGSDIHLTLDGCNYLRGGVIL